MGRFVMADVVRYVVSRHEGSIYQQDLYERVFEVTDPEERDKLSVDDAVGQLVESGEISPSITNTGKAVYTWTGRFTAPDPRYSRSDDS